jgi:hypothetical protein
MGGVSRRSFSFMPLILENREGCWRVSIPVAHQSKCAQKYGWPVVDFFKPISLQGRGVATCFSNYL